MTKLKTTIKVSLEITYIDGKIKAEKEFSSSTHNKAYKLAEKWMANCLAICGKDPQGRDYDEAELKVVESSESKT